MIFMLQIKLSESPCTISEAGKALTAAYEGPASRAYLCIRDRGSPRQSKKNIVLAGPVCTIKTSIALSRAISETVSVGLKERLWLKSYPGK